ncbi:hypothetical protein ADUPG1_011115 [Aduncisulcus paluster]|uniref:Uncharacterized protein n=1 Tax=Aduncisulcus paluster TaxID=2918883 RepID=A0ABQ5JUE2_9EUKA|nr:hypothetical protein ADUPG1_011115 [Aduncisulcus paluster]
MRNNCLSARIDGRLRELAVDEYIKHVFSVWSFNHSVATGEHSFVTDSSLFSYSTVDFSCIFLKFLKISSIDTRFQTIQSKASRLKDIRQIQLSHDKESAKSTSSSEIEYLRVFLSDAVESFTNDISMGQGRLQQLPASVFTINNIPQGVLFTSSPLFGSCCISDIFRRVCNCVLNWYSSEVKEIVRGCIIKNTTTIASSSFPLALPSNVVEDGSVLARYLQDTQKIFHEFAGSDPSFLCVLPSFFDYMSSLCKGVIKKAGLKPQSIPLYFPQHPSTSDEEGGSSPKKEEESPVDSFPTTSSTASLLSTQPLPLSSPLSPLGSFPSFLPSHFHIEEEEDDMFPRPASTGDIAALQSMAHQQQDTPYFASRFKFF